MRIIYEISWKFWKSWNENRVKKRSFSNQLCPEFSIIDSRFYHNLFSPGKNINVKNVPSFTCLPEAAYIWMQTFNLIIHKHFSNLNFTWIRLQNFEMVLFRQFWSFKMVVKLLKWGFRRRSLTSVNDGNVFFSIFFCSPGF